MKDRKRADRPLVSCIMPTRDRPQFAEQACKYFLEQSYARKELIVVADGESLGGRLPKSDSIRLVELPNSRSIGEKRNIACAFAQGDIVLQWDDDDWYGSDRISIQAEPIYTGAFDLTGLTCDVLLDLECLQFWRCDRKEHQRIFGKVACGTLAFRSEVWRKLARYPHQSIAEDAFFLQEAVRRGARLGVINQHGQFIYVRHSQNTWRLKRNCSWRQLSSVPLRGRDFRFYRGQSNSNLTRSHRTLPRPKRRKPLISCIMPTADRPAFVKLALRYFERQTYPDRELIVIDDGIESVRSLAESVEKMRYIRIAPGLSLGEKRNLACQEASGEFICHWDDDDWYAPTRLSYQISDLQNSEVNLCGLSRLVFLDIRLGRAWRYSYCSDKRVWLAGATLFYRRESWKNNPFDHLDTGEDNQFVFRFNREEIYRHDHHRFFVGLIHAANTRPKNLHAPPWAELNVNGVAQIMGEDFNRYINAPSPAGWTSST